MIRILYEDTQEQTVKEFLVKLLLDNNKKQRDYFRKSGLSTETFDKTIEQLESGELPKVGGDADALEDIYKSYEVKQGFSDVYYIINGNIKFYPNAKYGMFIKRA